MPAMSRLAGRRNLGVIGMAGSLQESVIRGRNEQRMFSKRIAKNRFERKLLGMQLEESEPNAIKDEDSVRRHVLRFSR